MRPLALLLLLPAAALAAVPWPAVWEVAQSPFVLGLAGSLITAARFSPGAPWGERLVNVAVGTVVAGIGAPALTEWTDLTRPAYANAAALALGLTGVSLASAVVQAARDQLPGLLARLLSLWTLRGK